MDNNGLIGVSKIEGDPKYNFLSKFTEETDNDNLFSNENLEASPYNEVDILTSYVDINQLANYANNKMLSVISINIQSLPSKYNDLTEILVDLKSHNICPDVICLQETWQVPDPTLYPLPDYHPLIIQTRTNSRGGGVGLYLKNNLQYRKLDGLSVFYGRLFESVLVEVTIPDGKKIIIGSIYRPGTLPPGRNFTQQFENFIDILTNQLSSINDISESVYLYGDLNLDVLKINESKFISEYIETLSSYGFLQIVTKPTRVTAESATLIDHVLTNATSDSLSTYILCYTMSDHVPIFHFLPLHITKKLPGTFSARNFSHQNVQNFKNALLNYTWQHVLIEEDAQSAYDSFSETFFQLYDLYFPIITKKLNPKYDKIEPWMTWGLLTSRKTKIKLNQIFSRKPTLKNRENFTKYRNLYNKLIREAKKLYFHQKLAEQLGNAKKTWQTLFMAIRKSKNTTHNCSSLLVDNSLITDPKTIAEKFNAFFINAASLATANIHPSPISPTQNIPQNPHLFSLLNIPITYNEILETTQLLLDKKTQDTNGLSSHIFKKIVDLIVVPLHHILHLSFQSVIVPTQLKIAKVVPIFKPGDRLALDNYRPISLLPTLSKIMEKIVSRRLMEFLNNHNILSQWQFGFRPRHSTVHPKMHFINHISDALDNEKHSIAIFCDLKKAFDSCDHTILLKNSPGMAWLALSSTGSNHILTIDNSL